MKYIVVRTYGNGNHMNKVYNLYFNWLSQAEKVAERLNKTDAEPGDKWICMPVNEYNGEI